MTLHLEALRVGATRRAKAPMLDPPRIGSKAQTDFDSLLAGVERRLHPHGLRHAAAARMARDGTPPNVIRDFLGHSSMAVTDRYLRDVAPMTVIAATQGQSWEL